MMIKILQNKFQENNWRFKKIKKMITTLKKNSKS